MAEVAAAAGGGPPVSSEFSNEYKDISQAEGHAMTKKDGHEYESRDKEYHHPDLYKYQSGRPFTLPNLVGPWDGKQVWCIIDPSNGIWRQATVLATAPPDPNFDKDARTSEWNFILDTKHDNWRHLYTQKPSDETYLAFDGIQVTEYALLPGKDDPSRVYQAPEYFELMPDGSPELSVARGATPVHPWIADELRALRRLIDELKKENERLKKENDALRAECEERRLNEERLAKQLQKERDERKIMEDKLNRQIAELKERERELLIKVQNYKDLINELQGEVNALNAKNDLLTKENALLMQTIAELKQENDELNLLVKSCQDALRVSNLARADLEEENRILRDRIQALDEALQKTIDSSNQSAHDTALKYAIEKAGMQAEIDRLRELLKGQQQQQQQQQQQVTVVAPTTNLVNEDDLELRKTIAMLQQDLNDKNGLLDQSFEEIKRLKELIEQYAGIDWKKFYEDLKKLSDRCAILEAARGWQQGIVGPVALDDDDELAKYRIYDGDEERANKRKERADRKRARALIRLASALVGEVNGVDTRIVELEKKVEHTPRAPPAEKTVPNPSAYSGNDRFIKVNKSDWLSKEMQIQFLAGQKDHTNLLASVGDMEVMQHQVAYLVQRNQDLMDLMNGFPDGRPQYTPTYARLLKGWFGRNQYDGNFPWLLTRQQHKLEKENTDLQRKMDLAAGKHIQQAELAETLVQPIATENAALREKLALYKAKLDELEASLAATKNRAGASADSGAAGFLETMANSVSSGLQDVGKSVGVV